MFAINQSISLHFVRLPFEQWQYFLNQPLAFRKPCIRFKQHNIDRFIMTGIDPVVALLENVYALCSASASFFSIAAVFSVLLRRVIPARAAIGFLQIHGHTAKPGELPHFIGNLALFAPDLFKCLRAHPVKIGMASSRVIKHFNNIIENIGSRFPRMVHMISDSLSLNLLLKKDSAIALS